MKRLHLKICCRIGGIIMVIIALFPIIRMIRQARGDGKMSYDDEVYFHYHAIFSVMILLGVVAAAITLFWMARRLK